MEKIFQDVPSKTTILQMRVTESEKKDLKNASENLGMSVTDLIKASVNDYVYNQDIDNLRDRRFRCDTAEEWVKQNFSGRFHTEYLKDTILEESGMEFVRHKKVLGNKDSLLFKLNDDIMIEVIYTLRDSNNDDDSAVLFKVFAY